MSELEKNTIKPALHFANQDEKYIHDRNTRKAMLEQGAKAKDVYIPRLAAYRILDDIRELPLEDMIEIYQGAKQAYKDGTFKRVNKESFTNQDPLAVRFVSNIKSIYTIIIESLVKAESVWVIYDDLTKTPFLVEENALLFTDRNKAEICIQNYQKQQRTTLYAKEETRVARFLRNAYYMLGIPSIIINKEGTSLKIHKNNITEFIEEPAKGTVTNPAFCLALAKLEQERLCANTYENKDKVIYDMETDLINTFCEAQFLVPLASNLKSTGELKKEGRTAYPRFPSDIPNVYTVPIFTDWNELNKAYGADKPDAMMWSIQDLLKVKDDLIINSKSFDFYITPEFIKTVYEEYQFLKNENK